MPSSEILMGRNTGHRDLGLFQGLLTTVYKLLNTPLKIALFFGILSTSSTLDTLTCVIFAAALQGGYYFPIPQIPQAPRVTPSPSSGSGRGPFSLLFSHQTPCHSPQALCTCGSVLPYHPLHLHLLQVSPPKSLPQSGFPGLPDVNQVRFSSYDSALK